MKRALIASILGIAASVATTYGQGHVLFSTYIDSTHFIQVGYDGSGGTTAGQVVGSGFTASLYYGLGSGVSFGSMTLIAGSGTAVGTQVPGTIIGPAVDMLNYVSGPVSFGINITGPGGAHGTVTWTEPSVASGLSAAGNFTLPLITAAAGQSYIPVTVPEPTTMALAGLGAAAMVIFRRRK